MQMLLDLLYPPDAIWWILWILLRLTSPPPQCVERFHRYHSNEKNVIASLRKFTGYIHNFKILPGNIFGVILKNKMAATGVFFTFSKEFCWPSIPKGIIGRDLNSQDMFVITKSPPIRVL